MFRYVFAMAAVVFLAGSVFATDGLWIDNAHYWTARSWSNIDCWYQEQKPSNGGVAIMPTWLQDLNQNVEGLTLSAMMFVNLSATQTVAGKAISMTGDAEICVKGSTAPVIKIDLPAANSDATLTKTGNGNWAPIYSTLTGYKSVTLADGFMRATNSTGNVITDSPFTLKNGRVDWAPSGSGAASATLPSLIVGRGCVCFSMDKKNQTSATLTIGSITVPDHCPIIFGTTGASTFGNTERVLIGEAASRPEVVNGLVDPRFVAQNRGSDGYPLIPLSYDETNGFVPATGTTLASGTDVPGLAKVTAATTVSADTKVGGLQVSGAQLTIAEGATLTVGDNNKPAAVWLSSPSVTNSITGTGTLAFGSSEGYIYRDTPATPASLYVNTPITGSKGVNFIVNRATANASPTSARPTLTFPKNYQIGWTGPTRIYGYTMSLSTRVFPYDHDIYAGGEMTYVYPSTRLTCTIGTYTNRLHLAGAGDGSGALDVSGGGWASQNWIMDKDGLVTLEEDAKINASSSTAANFKCPIVGRGGLTASGSVMKFFATNTYAGVTKVTCTHLMVDKGGTLGQGDIELGSSSKLYFLNSPSGQKHVVTNSIATGVGTVVVQKDQASFADDIEATEMILQAQAKVDTSAPVTVGYADFDYGCEFKGTSENAVLTVGQNAEETNVISSVLTGTLSLVKKGNNTLELLGPMTYTGATKIENGTLRLGRRDGTPNTADVSYWLDASDDNSLVWNEGNQSYTTWKSKPGYGISFSTPIGSTYSGSAPHGGVKTDFKMNDLTPLYFKRADTARMYGSSSVRQRQLIMAIMGGPDASKTSGGGGLFGRANSDHTAVSNHQIDLGQNNAGNRYPTWGYGYFNGAKKTTYVTLTDAPVILGFGHGADVVTGYSDYLSVPTFTPAIGGCQWDNRNWDGYFGEVLGFNRTLSDGERQRIENYLSEKWLGRTLTAEKDLAALPVTSISSASTLEVGAAGVFDLNGHEVTVAALSGSGTISNSSTNPATIRVTGACTFSGKVTGQVTLVASGAGAVNAAFRDGARLVVDGGSASLGSHIAGMPTDSIAFWVDAMDASTITTNDAGQVTNLTTKAGTIKSFFNIGVIDFWSRKAVPPMLDENAASFNGHPSIHFTCSDTSTYQGRSSMNSRETATVKTIAFVAKSGTANNYMIGANGNGEIGVIKDGDGLRATSVTFLRAGETVVLNDVDVSSKTYMGNLAVPATPYTFVCTCSDWSPYKSRRDSVKFYLGGYGNGGADYYLGEAIAWSRVLTPEECLAASKYLTSKWNATPTFSTNVLGAATGVGVIGGATLDMGGRDCSLKTLTGGDGGTLANVGTLTVSDGVTFAVRNGAVSALTVSGNLTLGSNAVATFLDGDTLKTTPTVQQVLSVTGAATGDFKSVDGLSSRWSLKKLGKLWSICRKGMIFLLH